MTNREKINNMSNEEFAIFLRDYKPPIYCNVCVAKEICKDIPHYNFIGCAGVIKNG